MMRFSPTSFASSSKTLRRTTLLPGCSKIQIPLLLLLLLVVVWSPQQVNADGHLFSESNYTSNSSSILTTPKNLSQVVCPSELTTFVALTEMVLEGRNDLLSLPERLELNSAFTMIYNALTQQSCDSYFRRIANLTFVNMTNNIGDVLVLKKDDDEEDPEEDEGEDEEDEEEGRRQRQRSLQAAGGGFETTNSSSVPPGVGITYQVVGTCRDCPVSRTGAFQLYDDTFRRMLRERSGFDLRPLRVLSITVEETTPSAYTDNDDCVCVEGMEPLEPQAPGVQECVDEMNVKFDNLRAAGTGLFESIEMTDLLQYDDLEVDDEVDYEEEEEEEEMEDEEEVEDEDDTNTTETTTEEEEEEDEEEEDESVSRTGNENIEKEDNDNEQEGYSEPSDSGGEPTNNSVSSGRKTTILLLGWIFVMGVASTLC